MVTGGSTAKRLLEEGAYCKNYEFFDEECNDDGLYTVKKCYTGPLTDNTDPLFDEDKVKECANRCLAKAVPRTSFYVVKDSTKAGVKYPKDSCVCAKDDCATRYKWEGVNSYAATVGKTTGVKCQACPCKSDDAPCNSLVCPSSTNQPVFHIVERIIFDGKLPTWVTRCVSNDDPERTARRRLTAVHPTTKRATPRQCARPRPP